MSCHSQFITIQPDHGVPFKIEIDYRDDWKGSFHVWAHTQERGYVGELRVAEDRVMKSSLDEDMRGKGVGFALYEEALKFNGRLCTNYRSASKDAQRVWDKLALKYAYERNGDYITFHYP